MALQYWCMTRFQSQQLPLLSQHKRGFTVEVREQYHICDLIERMLSICVEVY